MPAFAFAPAWTSLFLGLFALFAGIGALRQPGLWPKMMQEISASPALQMLVGFVELAIGSIVYLVNPWVPGDWLACVMKALGGLMAIEALVILAFSDRYLGFWLRRFGTMVRIWTWLTMLIGVVLIVVAIPRFS